jgi:hypothetical protein
MDEPQRWQSCVGCISRVAFPYSLRLDRQKETEEKIVIQQQIVFNLSFQNDDARVLEQHKPDTRTCTINPQARSGASWVTSTASAATAAAHQNVNTSPGLWWGQNLSAVCVSRWVVVNPPSLDISSTIEAHQ